MCLQWHWGVHYHLAGEHLDCLQDSWSHYNDHYNRHSTSCRDRVHNCLLNLDSNSDGYVHQHDHCPCCCHNIHPDRDRHNYLDLDRNYHSSKRHSLNMHPHAY